MSLLVDDALVASWLRQGLPSDPTSVGNGAILANSERWPLMMDPQLQGVLWVKEREAKNNLQVGWVGAVCSQGRWVRGSTRERPLMLTGRNAHAFTVQNT